jgi:DNA-binding MarR family transcriptional regulator
MSMMIHLTEKGEEAYNEGNFDANSNIDVDTASILSYLMNDPDMPVEDEILGYNLKILREDLDKAISKLEKKGQIARYKSRMSNESRKRWNTQRLLGEMESD